MSRVRYRGLARNACHLRFVVTAMNMKRALVLMEQNWGICFRPIRRWPLRKAIEQVRQPQDAHTLAPTIPSGHKKPPSHPKKPQLWEALQ
jgi:hypothetical protein